MILPWLLRTDKGGIIGQRGSRRTLRRNSTSEARCPVRIAWPRGHPLLRDSSH